MAKSIKDILEVAQPKSDDEKAFKRMHVIAKIADRNGNPDSHFNGDSVKFADREKEGHGYNPGNDAKVYEDVGRFIYKEVFEEEILDEEADEFADFVAELAEELDDDELEILEEILEDDDAFAEFYARIMTSEQ